MPFPSVAMYPALTIPAQVHVSAGAVIVMEVNSGVIIYEKNPSLRLSPASTTKIMTTLTAMNYFQLTDVLTVRGPLDPEGSGLGLIKDQQLTFESLLYGMLLPSANDAAQTVAQNYPGGEDAFVAKMNANAKAWHLRNTHFADPAGLLDDEDYTTVTDMAHLAALAVQNPIITNIVKQKNAVITTVDRKNIYPLQNRNILLGLYGINGMKTGYTDGAKEVLVTSVTREDHKYIIVVMDSDDRFADTVKLVTTILPNITYLSMNP